MVLVLGESNIMADCTRSIVELIVGICVVMTWQSVDYGRMAEILVQRAGSPHAFTRLTSITWVCLLHHLLSPGVYFRGIFHHLLSLWLD
jgi:hypothetical protein